MSCCGNKRISFYQEPSAAYDRHPLKNQGNSAGNEIPERSARYSTIIFEYTGKTGMTVQGSATGKKYRFEAPGSRVIIDPMDRPSVKLVPNLRQVYI